MFVSMIAESRARCSSTNRFFSQHESLEEAEVRVAELERELIVTSDAYDRALTSLAISKKREERLVVQLASAENSAQRQLNKVESSAANQAATQQVSAERAATKAKRKHAELESKVLTLTLHVAAEEDRRKKAEVQSKRDSVLRGQAERRQSRFEVLLQKARQGRDQAKELDEKIRAELETSWAETCGMKKKVAAFKKAILARDRKVVKLEASWKAISMRQRSSCLPRGVSWAGLLHRPRH